MNPRLAALAVAAAALLTPSAAQAADVALTFDNAVLDTPATPDQVVVDPSGPPITATAVVDEATGAFTVDPAAFDFPRYSFSSPTTGNIDVILNAPAGGQIDLATGKVTVNADFEAQITLDAFGSCNIDTGPLVLSTETAEPLPGVRFPPGVTGFATGKGAAGVEWATLPPGTGPGCALIDSFVAGPGGFWMSRGISPAPPAYAVAKLAVRVSPKRRTVRAGQRARFRVRVRNTGADAATRVKLCARAPKLIKRACTKLGTLAAGATQVVRFSARTRRGGKRRTLPISFTATGRGVMAGRATAKVTVKPRG